VRSLQATRNNPDLTPQHGILLGHRLKVLKLSAVEAGLRQTSRQQMVMACNMLGLPSRFLQATVMRDILPGSIDLHDTGLLAVVCRVNES
jgi:hypothetical protein